MTQSRTTSSSPIRRVLDYVQMVDRFHQLHLDQIGLYDQAFQQDLCLMLEHNDLRCLHLTLLNSPGQPVTQYRFNFLSSGKVQLEIDPGSSPTARAQIRQARLSVRRRGLKKIYSSQLQLQWKPPAAPSRSVASRSSPEKEKSTPWRVLEITRAGRHSFAFARSCDDRACIENVFLHTRHAPKGHRFETGQRLRAQLIKTEKGWQARQVIPV